jgi:hypothetical protein
LHPVDAHLRLVRYQFGFGLHTIIRSQRAAYEGNGHWTGAERT